MKIAEIIAKWSFVLCLPVLLLSASLGWAINSRWLYDYGAEKYGVRQTLTDSGLELTVPELRGIYAGLISYYNSGEEYINFTVVKNGQPTDLFTREESLHFRDVKGLIRLDYWLLGGTLLYVLAYCGATLLRRRGSYHRELARDVARGSVLTLALILALGLGTLLGFDQLFLQFHLLFFSNPYWYARGFMLLLFPGGFFYDVTLFCATAIAITSLVLGGVAWRYLVKSKASPD